ncbi:MAG: hypothetical protein WD512_12500 [Candidatus Paceibacterota bacterium]
MNFEIALGSIGFNIVSLIFFLLLFYNLKSEFHGKHTKFIRAIATVLMVLITIVGLITPKSSKYDQPKYNNELTIELDTTASYGDHYLIKVPEDWEKATNYQGTSLFAISPARDSLDFFRENFNIQVYGINYDVYSSEIVAMKIFSQGTAGIEYDLEVLETEPSDDFYAIEYLLSDSTIKVQSKLFCKVVNGKAYSIIFSDHKETFTSNLNEVFEPIKQTFKIK